MNGLLKIEVNDNQEQTVSGRELHMFMGIETRYDTWFNRMLQYGFEEGKDFCSKMSESTGGRPSTDHLMKIDMAKELCMLARNEKGKQARQYFLEVEREWNSPEKTMARALLMAQKTIENNRARISRLESDNDRMRPKEIFADAVAASKTSILIGDLAKILKQNGINMGQKRLFEWLRQHGYLIKRKGSEYNSPTQKAMEMKLFEIKENTIPCADGHIIVNKTTKVTGKGQIYFINLFKKEADADADN